MLFTTQVRRLVPSLARSPAHQLPKYRVRKILEDARPPSVD